MNDTTDLVEVARSILMAPYTGLRREPCPICTEAGFVFNATLLTVEACTTCGTKGYILREQA